MTRVVVHIDRLVLDGIGQADRHAFVAGLQQELQRGLGGPEIAAQLRTAGDLARLQVGGVNIARNSTPHDAGESVARGIGREIKR